ncbi:MAG: YdbL family protein [Desulfosarcinaceae bacterium]|nr:YdbL family protein [Desulfosarcinaceae bacterium]
MKTRSNLMLCLLTTSLVFSFVTAAWAQDIKSRMRSRLPDIVALKAEGVIGENNQGYLTILKAPTDKKALIAAENKDRRTVYNAIAKKQGTTPALVGQRRALQIAKKADPGTMIQGEDGQWRAK